MYRAHGLNGQATPWANNDTSAAAGHSGADVGGQSGGLRTRFAEFSDGFTGIPPTSVSGFMVAELVGAGIGLGIHRWLEAGTAKPPARLI